MESDIIYNGRRHAEILKKERIEITHSPPEQPFNRQHNYVNYRTYFSRRLKPI